MAEESGGRGWSDWNRLDVEEAVEEELVERVRFVMVPFLSVLEQIRYVEKVCTVWKLGVRWDICSVLSSGLV